MILVAAAAVLLAIIVGGRPLGAWLRRAGGSWRPAAGLLAILALAAALMLFVREAWLPAVALAGVALALAVSARRRPARRLSDGSMSAEQARAILGLEPRASHADVQAAYRRLMGMAHPDRGGTRGLAAQLNAARDVLLGRP